MESFPSCPAQEVLSVSFRWGKRIDCYGQGMRLKSDIEDLKRIIDGGVLRGGKRGLRAEVGWLALHRKGKILSLKTGFLITRA